MGASERRLEILKILCRRRHETISKLASEFGVSGRTIARDIEALSISHPIYTQQGKYGGIYVTQGYSMDRMYMCDEELTVLKKLAESVEGSATILTRDEKKILGSIISVYTKPVSGENF